MKAFSEVEGPCRGGGEGPWAVGAVALGGAGEAEADGLLDPGGHEGGGAVVPRRPATSVAEVNHRGRRCVGLPAHDCVTGNQSRGSFGPLIHASKHYR